MNSWSNVPKIPILSEQELEDKFVALSAKWINSKYSAFEIARYVFDGQVDGEARSMQAATQWQFDLRVQERIRQAAQAASQPDIEILTREQWQTQIKKISLDFNMSPRDKKAAIDGLRLYGESEGWVVKSAVVKSTSDKPETGADFLAQLQAKLPD